MRCDNPRGQIFTTQPMGQCLASNYSAPTFAVFSPALADFRLPPTRTRVTNTMGRGA